MQVGLVGKPSSGKSTLFNALTLLDAAMASYPFTTIEPNKGIGFVRVDCVDKEFGKQCKPRTGYCENGTRYVPAEVIDVAGLVPGASEGRGKGNEFLSDLSHADVLIHVVDASGSTNEEGQLVPMGSHDPVKDVRFLEDEIDLWFAGVIAKNFKKFGKTPFEGKGALLKAMAACLSGIGGTERDCDLALDKAGLLNKKLQTWDENDIKAFATALRKVSKPMVIAANKIDLPGAEKNVERIRKEFPHLTVIGCSAIAELTLKRANKDGTLKYLPGSKDFTVLKDLNEAQQKGLEYIRKNVLEKFGSTGVQELLDKTVFDALGYIAVFPGGTKKLEDSQGRTLPDCFLMPPKSTALDFAFKLHTDFGNHFIRAVNVKNHLMIGKDHELQHRDVVEIIHGA
ncbi:MAG TPA: redox-regulated ATPase YchF [Candidatus Diapherotrites archaeon]|uniref:Redox-regulated ATPase YchF n=1 Tax=Candidatus Iainarchaeum sp. TaxID=3101447 RepID=A0A7J4JPH5_9ARCH|nr:redox-regulated ATPase YchF [Candidatus Diapherotrites archaeon]HIH17106.1 redox-regulated ATPase YchF [Candidatus Diapherotrites archaeon]